MLTVLDQGWNLSGTKKGFLYSTLEGRTDIEFSKAKSYKGYNLSNMIFMTRENGEVIMSLSALITRLGGITANFFTYKNSNSASSFVKSKTGELLDIEYKKSRFFLENMYPTSLIANGGEWLFNQKREYEKVPFMTLAQNMHEEKEYHYKLIQEKYKSIILFVRDLVQAGEDDKLFKSHVEKFYKNLDKLLTYDKFILPSDMFIGKFFGSCMGVIYGGCAQALKSFTNIKKAVSKEPEQYYSESGIVKKDEKINISILAHLSADNKIGLIQEFRMRDEYIKALNQESLVNVIHRKIPAISIFKDYPSAAYNSGGVYATVEDSKVLMSRFTYEVPADLSSTQLYNEFLYLRYLYWAPNAAKKSLALYKELEGKVRIKDLMLMMQYMGEINLTDTYQHFVKSGTEVIRTSATMDKMTTSYANTNSVKRKGNENATKAATLYNNHVRNKEKYSKEDLEAVKTIIFLILED